MSLLQICCDFGQRFKDLFLQRTLPRLIKFALQLPVTQASVERVFSSLKYALNDIRMRLGDDTIDTILVLRANK